MQQIGTRPVPGSRLRGFSSAAILVAGVVLVPLALNVAFTSWSAPDAHAYVRMAFAQVAGSVIALATVIGLVIQRVVRRSPAADVVWFAGIAVVVIVWQTAALSAAADMLVHRLSLLGA